MGLHGLVETARLETGTGSEVEHVVRAQIIFRAAFPGRPGEVLCAAEGFDQGGQGCAGRQIRRAVGVYRARQRLVFVRVARAADQPESLRDAERCLSKRRVALGARCIVVVVVLEEALEDLLPGLLVFLEIVEARDPFEAVRTVGKTRLGAERMRGRRGNGVAQTCRVVALPEVASR